MNKLNKHQNLTILSLFIIWRGGLFLLAYLAPRFLSYKPSFPYAGMLASSGLPAWIYSWANFDGVHYLTIARQGYQGVGLIQAFFPVFPFLLRFGYLLTGLHFILVGLVISSLATLVSLFLINASLKVWRFSWPSRLVVLTTFLALSGSLFMGAVYTEGLFIMLVWLNLYFLAKKNYLLATLVATLASATRLTGVFLVLPIIMAYLDQQVGWSWLSLNQGVSSLVDNFIQAAKKLQFKGLSRLVLFSLVGGLGLFVYMGYLAYHYHDPLYFLHVQNEFGLGKEERIVLYPQVVWRGLKILWSVRPFDLKYLTYVQEFFWGTVGLTLIILSWWLKKMPRYLFWLSLAFFFLPTSIGTFSSMSRYILPAAALPFGFLLIYQKNRWLYYFSLVGIMALLMINTLMFIQGYWVA